MAGRGAPQGNQNAAKAKIWSEAITRVLESRKPRKEQSKCIDELAEQLIDKCYEGDLNALKELGDRLEGKAAQTHNAEHKHSGTIRGVVEFLGPE